MRHTRNAGDLWVAFGGESSDIVPTPPLILTYCCSQAQMKDISRLWYASVLFMAKGLRNAKEQESNAGKTPRLPTLSEILLAFNVR